MRIVRALIASATLLLLTAGPASAATTIGQLQPVYAGAFCGGGASVQTKVPSGTTPYVVPAGGGVITSWRTQTASGAGTAKLKAYRSTGVANEYLIVGEDGPHSVGANQSPAFSSGVRVPVEAGDLIGLTASGTNCIFYIPGSEYFISSYGIGNDPLAGTIASTVSGVGQEGLEVEATVEPDADRDGYGDETQDQCPLDPAAQVAPCPVHVGPPAPDTTPPQETLSARATQDALKQGGVKVRAKANEAVTFNATGSISIPASGKSFSLVPASASAVAGVGTTLKLGLSKAARKKVKAALGAGSRVRASVHVVAVDSAGNRSSANQAVTIKRAPRKA